MNRHLFLASPWHVRMARYLRRRRAEGMAVPNRRADPRDRPLNVHRIYFVVIVFVAAIFLWIGEQSERNRQKRMAGLYEPVKPIHFRIDCSAEAREACRVQSRMEKVKKP